MRTLSDSEKSDIKALFESRGFAIMDGLVKEYKHDLLSKFAILPLGDPNVIEELTQKQNHLKGIKDFLNVIKGKSSGIGKKQEKAKD